MLVVFDVVMMLLDFVVLL